MRRHQGFAQFRHQTDRGGAVPRVVVGHHLAAGDDRIGGHQRAGLLDIVHREEEQAAPVATGVVLALVAAGLVVSAIHTAHEAGWLNVGQERLLDLSWLVRPGTVVSSLLTGMLGIQPYPVMAEILGWLLYAIPVVVFVAWPPGRAVPHRALRSTLAGIGALGLVVGGAIAWSAPSVTTPVAATGSGALQASIVDADGGPALRTIDQHPLAGTSGSQITLPLGSGSLTRGMKASST